jgi:hypothetical protein
LFVFSEGEDKIMVGKTILVEDKANGGVTSYTHVNATWGKHSLIHIAIWNTRPDSWLRAACHRPGHQAMPFGDIMLN